MDAILDGYKDKLNLKINISDMKMQGWYENFE